MPENLENLAVATGLKKVIFHPIPKKGNAKEYSKCHTIALISHTSKVMLKILQARLQQNVNSELPHVQAGIKIAGRNINNLRYADTTLMAESEEELNSLLAKVIEESEKVVLKLNIQKTKIMVSGHITSWQIHGETVADFIFWGSKITADGHCNHEIKRHLLLGRKVMFNLDSILKSRDITLSTKVHLSRLWFFQWSCMDVRVGL